MKKILFILSLLLISLITLSSDAQQKTFYYTINKESEKAKDSAIKHLVVLFDIGLYDSVIAYCGQLRSADVLDFSTLELTLATAYRYKGNTDMAYQYVLNSADYSLKINAGGGNAFMMLENYKDAYPLASDTVLEQIISNKVKEYYLKQDYYANPAMGLKFIMLYHTVCKLQNLHNYLLNKTDVSIDEKSLQENFDLKMDSIYTIYKTIIDNNGGFYPQKEIGNAFIHQFWLVSENNDIEFHKLVFPYFEKAFLEKQIEPETYVFELMNVMRFEEKDNVKLASIRDSLCALYGCAASNTVITQNGDTMYFKEAPAAIVK